jgi:tetratricopeptide (TPR) repeat protein
MGAVYAAFDLELEENIALKVLHGAIASTDGALERFRREVKLARRVTHANVARTYDFGSSGETRFITMELLIGKSLADRIDTEPLGLADALRISADIAQGLAAAHLAGVVHRDLKPDNVLIDMSGAGPDGGERTVITDFGIAVFATTPTGVVKQTQTIAGTPAYMAPEQLQGKELDGRADVYALGVIMYELLARRLPFIDDTPYALAVRRLTEDPPDPRKFVPDIPEPIVRLVLDMLARERDERPDTQAVIDRLDALRGGGRSRAANTRLIDTGMRMRFSPPPALVVWPRLEAIGTDSMDLAEAVADALAGEKAVRTIAPLLVRSRALAAKPETLDLAALLSELRATHLVEVHIESGQTRARIVDSSLALVGSHVVEGSEVAVVAPKLAARIARAVDGLRATDPGGAVRTTANSGAVDSSVAALYQEAMAELARFGLEHTSRGIEILHKAEAIAPSDPFIASALGAALVNQWSFQNDRSLLGQAEEYSLRALAANPHIGETFNTIGVLRLHQGELRAAVRAFEEAAARSPRLAEPHSYIGRLLAESGKQAEAESRLKQAIKLDPQDYYAASELSRMAALNGDWERADALLEEMLQRTGQRIILATQARYALWRGDLGRLNQLVTEIDKSGDPAFHLVKRVFVPIWTAFVVNDAIEPNDPRLGALRSTAAGTSMRMTTFWHQLLAEIYATLSHTSAAIDSIERAVGRSLVDVLWLDRCVLLDGLRTDVRFVRARTATAAQAASLWR